MRLLVADDDRSTRVTLSRHCEKWGYDVVEARDGKAALDVLTGKNPPRIAILDWIMPEMDGVDVCLAVHQQEPPPLVYIILLTIKHEKADIVFALDSGAHDFLSKPVHPGELRSRIDVGRRLIEAELAREQLIGELQQALNDNRLLRGLLPICAECKRIRDDQGEWTELEAYIGARSEAEFTHGVCPDCVGKLYPHLKKTT
jgi:DNA-binding response OmpR family regulator